MSSGHDSKGTAGANELIALVEQVKTVANGCANQQVQAHKEVNVAINQLRTQTNVVSKVKEVLKNIERSHKLKVKELEDTITELREKLNERDESSGRPAKKAKISEETKLVSENANSSTAESATPTAAATSSYLSTLTEAINNAQASAETGNTQVTLKSDESALKPVESVASAPAPPAATGLPTVLAQQPVTSTLASAATAAVAAAAAAADAAGSVASSSQTAPVPDSVVPEKVNEETKKVEDTEMKAAVVEEPPAKKEEPAGLVQAVNE